MLRRLALVGFLNGLACSPTAMTPSKPTPVVRHVEPPTGAEANALGVSPDDSPVERAKRRPAVTLQAIDVDRIPPAESRMVIENAIPTFHQCWHVREDTARTVFRFHGRFAVDSSGRISRREVSSDDDVARCVAATIESLHIFTTDSGSLTVTMVLSSESDAPP